MRFLNLILPLFILTSAVAFADGRKPAVDDFVGIEVDHPESIPQGSDSLFNLEKDMSQIGVVKAELTKIPQKAPEKKVEVPKPWSASAVLGIIMILGMPMLSWILALHHLRKKASAENASNIEVLEKYRKERELARKAESEIKKAS